MREIERGSEKSKEQIEAEIKSKIAVIYKWSFPKQPVQSFAIVSLDGKFFTSNVTFEEEGRQIDIKPGNIQELPGNTHNPISKKFSSIPVITDIEAGKLLNRASIVVGADEDTNFQTRLIKESIGVGNFRHYTYPHRI